MIEDFYKKYNVDISKLSRDYLKYPLNRPKNRKLFEEPKRADVEYLYNDCNVPLKDLLKYFGLSSLYKYFQKYNIKKNLEKKNENIRQSNIDTYKNNKELLDRKRKETCLKKYGKETIFQTDLFKEKVKETLLKKYGVDNVMKADIFKQKCAETCLKKYGVPCYTQSSEFKNHMSELKQDESYIWSSQHHLSEEAYKCSTNKEYLKTYILNSENKTVAGLANQLNVSRSRLLIYIKKYSLKHLINNQESHFENDIKHCFNIKLERTKSQIYPYEIDLYSDEKKIGIEFNGSYWHSEKHLDKNYHFMKSKLAEEKGIFLYHIFEYEWLQKRELILNQLNNLLGINQTKIGARKCVIKDVSNKEKNDFLTLNHLQGNDKSNIKLGLYYEDKLVSIMTFCKPRFNKKYEWELSRFCSLAGCNVVGGASKLFKYFVDNYTPQSIISYSDIAKTKGNLYKTLGFELLGISEPNYVWCNGRNQFFTRYQCQKHKLLKQGFEGVSEVEIMHNRGYYKIYDCGNKVWIWDRSKI